MYLFIAFDVVEFYPSISIELLRVALQFASEYDTITDNERHIILQAKSSLIYKYGEPWGKKPHQIFLTSLWGGTTVLNLVSWLVLISSTKSKRSLAAHAILACTVMMASGSQKHHHGKRSSSKKIYAAFSVTVAWKLQSRPTRKQWTSSMSPSICPVGSTWLTRKSSSLMLIKIAQYTFRG